jgi:hypothetical protein
MKAKLGYQNTDGEVHQHGSQKKPRKMYDGNGLVTCCTKGREKGCGLDVSVAAHPHITTTEQ